METLTQINWHEFPADAATKLLQSDPSSGLTADEVAARLRQFGPNQMTAKTKLSEWMRFFCSFISR